VKTIKFLWYLFLIQFSCNFNYSQSNSHFIDTNKLWSVLHYPYMHWPQHTTHYLKIGHSTTINDTVYYELIRSDDRDHVDWNNYGYIREDSAGKVFYRITNTSSEGLVYHNNAQKGDTLLVATRRYDANFLRNYEMTIDSIDSIELSGEIRKRFFLLDGIETWIEGIGALSGFLYNWNGYVGGDQYILLCFKQNDTLVYKMPTNMDCFDINTSTRPIDNQEEVKIYPNPVIDKRFILHCQESGTYRIKIYNVLSELIIEFMVEDISQQEIQLDSFQKGIYFIHIEDVYSNKEYFNKLIII